MRKDANNDEIAYQVPILNRLSVLCCLLCSLFFPPPRLSTWWRNWRVLSFAFICCGYRCFWFVILMCWRYLLLICSTIQDLIQSLSRMPWWIWIFLRAYFILVLPYFLDMVIRWIAPMHFLIDLSYLGLVFSNGEYWASHRKALMPLFAPTFLKKYGKWLWESSCLLFYSRFRFLCVSLYTSVPLSISLPTSRYVDTFPHSTNTQSSLLRFTRRQVLAP